MRRLLDLPRSMSTALISGSVTILCACTPRPEAAPDEPTAKPVASDTIEPTAQPATATAPPPSAPPSRPTPPDATAEPAPAPDPLAPLPDAVYQQFATLPRDPKPESLVRNSHYWISNELNQQLWHESIVDQGGAYLGVGTDQNYMLAGWANSDLIVVVDFDLAITDLHRAYAAFFDETPTFDDFLMRWSSEQEQQSLALLDQRYADQPDAARIHKAYKIARQLVWVRLRNLRKAYEERGIPTFISDQAQYDHIRTLSQNRRIFAVRGDFTADKTMVALRKAMESSNLDFHVIYLSNVEQYIDYSPEFRRNIGQLPVSDGGVVIRTLGWGAFGFAEGEQYHYNVQSLPNFIEWLNRSRVKNLPNMLYFRTKTKTQGLSRLDGTVKVSSRPPVIAP